MRERRRLHCCRRHVFFVIVESCTFLTGSLRIVVFLHGCEIGGCEVKGKRRGSRREAFLFECRNREDEEGLRDDCLQKYNETPPKPFKLRRSGDLDLLLTRRKGAEDIHLKCALAFHPRGGPPDELFEDELEDDEAREQKVVVNITMTVTKGGPEALELNVDCDRRGYIVNSIIYRENNKDTKHDDDEFFPAFWRIGPELRSEFHNFLEQRGLDEIFACWVHDQMDDKAYRARWRHLENIHAFVENK